MAYLPVHFIPRKKSSQIKILNNVMRNQLFPEFDSHLSYKTFLLQSNGSKSLGACSVTPL